jgi:branched-chain amino acid transport system permease protein
MFYREVGQFKTTYKADQSIFPILQDKIGMAVILLIAFIGDPAVRQRLFPQLDHDPVPDLLAGGDRPEHPDRVTGQLSLGTGAFMGVGAYACYKLTTFFPDVNIIIMVLMSGVLLGRPSGMSSACRHCASRGSTWR